MRQITRALLLVLLAGVYTNVFPQQEANHQKTAPPRFKHHGEIDTKYDPSSDKTTVVLNPYRIGNDSREMNVYSIMCGFTYQGRSFTGKVLSIEFHIFSDTIGGFKFNKEKKRVLSATIDKERIEIGEMRLVNARHYAFGSSPVNRLRDGYREEIYIPLTRMGIEKIASGKRVTLLVGEQKLVLDEERLEALRDLISRMEP